MNRLRGSFPKVGIRPAIDGRRKGVRESLEQQTMLMAQSAAELISKNLFYPDGSPVQCIIADTCIGGVTESAECAEKFAREGVGVSLTVSPCWCYGTEVMDTDPLTPKAVWGFNGTERPGAVFLAAVLAGHAQKGLPAFGIYGHDVQDKSDTSIPEDVKAKILRFTKAALGVAYIKGKSYLSMGSVSMGIAGSVIDASFFQDYLGMRNEYVDMSEFNQEEKDRIWEDVVKMSLIARDLMVGNHNLNAAGFGEEALGHNAILAGFQGQRHWTDHRPNGDFMEAILNSSFDWNGVRQPYLLATENDALNGVAMLFGHLLTNTAQMFSDVRTYWSPEAVKRVTGKTLEGTASNGLIHLINSGASALDFSGRQTKNGNPAIKPFWEITKSEADDCLKATSWPSAVYEYFRGGGYSSEFLTKGGMPITMSRVNLIKGLGPVLQIAEGWSVELPEDINLQLTERTNPTWPTTWFAPRLNGEGAFKDVYSVMANWGANHGAISYGHIGADLIAMAAMLRIPVCMHNVEANEIFRPNAWSAFGTSDLEGADYRACANFGPIYG